MTATLATLAKIVVVDGWSTVPGSKSWRVIVTTERGNVYSCVYHDHKPSEDDIQNDWNNRENGVWQQGAWGSGQ